MSETKVAKKVLEDVVDLGSDVLEALHRSSQRMRGREGGPGSDLLYSFVKLQATQLNHLARLGLAQTEFARRQFESLFGGDGLRSCDIQIEGDVGKQVSETFTVKNPKTSKATLGLKCSCFSQVGREHQFNHTVTFGRKGRGKPPASLPAKGEQVLSIHFRLDPKEFMAGESYYANVSVLFDDEVSETKGVLVKVS